MNEETNVDCTNSTIEKEVHHTCCYCGQEAHYQFKNGKWCCSSNQSKCPECKKQIAESVKLRHQKNKEEFGDARFTKQTARNQIKYPPRGDHVCVYCGGYAEYQLKDGRWCCQKTQHKCPEIRKKNSQSLQGRIAWSKGRPAWNKGLTKETDSRVANHSKSLKQKYASGFLSPNKGRRRTLETKQKLSEIMKQKILSGEMETPYKRNHYSKGPSYPEQYFLTVFKNASLDIRYNFHVGLYRLDFANELSKKYIEIDGEQHYVDSRIVEHDVKRTKDLSQQGWKLICRIRWSKFQKLTLEQKEMVCKQLIANLK